MRKYESVKRIDLMDREPTYYKTIQNRNQSNTRSSRNTSKENNEFECLTDRSRNHRINEFSSVPSFELGTVPGIKSNIKTFVRFRPFSKKEMIDENSVVSSTVIPTRNRAGTPDCIQAQVYEECAKELVQSFLNGFNATIFAYGQTGSGKTHTMFGENHSVQYGIIPRIIEDIFVTLDEKRISNNQEVTLSCSMYEIYKENVCDLMSENQKEVKIKENVHGDIQIENLTTREIKNKKELTMWIQQGSDLRKVRETEVNERSSRSHFVLTLYFTHRISENEVRSSKLNLVDLAGSEKVSKSKVSGEGLEETIKINLSLSCLGNTIYALSKGQEHVPFRDSKLTRVLQESLSGNSLTRVIVTCSLFPSCKEETLSSIKFANRVKKLKTFGTQNLKKVNEQNVNKYMYQTLKIEYQNCEEKLERIRKILDASCSESNKEIIESIKAIVSFSDKEKLSQENEFLIPFSQLTETFKSPSKEPFYDLKEVISNQKSNNTNHKENLEEQIKKLEIVVFQQESLIKKQAIELEKLSSISLKGEETKQKLKIIKANPLISNGGNKNEKQKLLINKSNKLNQITTYKTNYEDVRKIEQPPFLFELKGLIESFSKAKRSYEKMEKEILGRQIECFGKELYQLHGLVKEKGLILEVKAEENEYGREELWKREMENKNSYINELELKLLNKLVCFEECYGKMGDELEDDQSVLKERNENTWCSYVS